MRSLKILSEYSSLDECLSHDCPCVLRSDCAGQEVSWGDPDESEDYAHRLGEETGSNPGAHQVQQPTQVCSSFRHVHIHTTIKTLEAPVFFFFVEVHLQK